jgi:bifunctional UDP-N-acetylglucosamine pyrophosphorylase/glucosamine-1-phosphate N-acetyltransferase
MTSLGVVILAAGKGTRLKLDRPKALCPILGQSLIDFVLNEIESFAQETSVEAALTAVVGHKKEQIMAHLEDRQINFAEQKEQLGTAHAVQSYFEADKKNWDYDYTLICCADTPCLDKKIFTEMLKKVVEEKLDGVCASFKTANPYGYGRIVHGEKGFNIIEEKDATVDQRKINEVNSGLYIFKTSHIKDYLSKIGNKNKSGEYYLTDLVDQSFNVKTICFEEEGLFQGVNNLLQLESAQKFIQNRINQKHQLNGVIMMNSESIMIEPKVKIEPGVMIYPNCFLFGETLIESDVTIEQGTTIKNTTIKKQTHILANCYFEDAIIGEECSIGPMARIRPGSQIGKKVKIGNFVETKKVDLHEGVKVSHLSYVGDAEIGENTNIGCGFITCNYDGTKKHKTIIGKNSFIGSDCQMVAPVTIGNGVYIGSGSTINQDVPDDAFAIARERQVNKEGMAKRFKK